MHVCKSGLPSNPFLCLFHKFFDSSMPKIIVHHNFEMMTMMNTAILALTCQAILLACPAVGFTSSTTRVLRVSTSLPAAYVSPSSSSFGGFSQYDLSVFDEAKALFSTSSPMAYADEHVHFARQLSLASLKPAVQATKGFVSSTVYGSTVLATSVLIRSGMKIALSIVPTWVRFQK